MDAENDASVKQLLQKKDEIEHKLELNIAATRSLLNDRAKNLIPDKIFHIQTMHLSDELDELECKQSELHSRLVRKRDEEKGVSNWLELIDKYLDLPSLDRMIVAELVDSIEVYESTFDGRRHIELGVHYRFVGSLSITKKDIA